MRVAERIKNDAGKSPAAVAGPSVPTTGSGSVRKRRGVNREGLEAGRRSTRTLLWILLAAAMVLYGFPFLYLLFTSFKTPIDTIAVPPTILPKEWTLENYANALGRSGVVASFINSIQTAIISTLLSLVLAVPAAYGITRYQTLSGRIFIMAALVTRMVPPVAIGIPLASMMASMGLADTPIALSIAHTTISLPLSIWLMSSFFEAVPRDLEEAATVDGCSRLGALWRVVIPVVSGGIAVTAIFAFLASWNEFLFALLMTAIRSQTTPVVIANFQTQFGLDWGSMTALAAVYSIPVILLTLLLQRKIVAGMTLGAVKG
ncbi:multiple sugar transport system permease protein [Pseudarthrobacter sp. W1I19]|uniref:carbohydrate ABC transporter permease n=1 Tax=Pseudarthrobacter sp. W1I19 TaxID=3042288 RepID=UPI00278AEDC2|nr:carbohydrate ABC transporter permease [Pseudarthrobacter sp. W1I19]MDQ0922396.1 multiple sugar transport system permease protein [Pseudarthrobacter sp. W1I19]